MCHVINVVYLSDMNIAGSIRLRMGTMDKQRPCFDQYSEPDHNGVAPYRS